MVSQRWESQVVFHMNDNGEVVDDNDDDDKGETEEEDIDLN